MARLARGCAIIVMGALALGGATGASGATSAPPDHTAARQASLDAARARWKAFGADSYSYRSQGRCSMCANVSEVTVTVVHGRSTVKPSGHRDVATVPRLFALIQALIDDDPYTLTVAYGPRSGVPSSISSKDSQTGLDDVSGLRISRFHRLGHVH